jgi:hypothetical protein
MDAKVLEALTALINQRLTAQLILTALLAVIAAALGAYFGSYLAKKAERLAASESFRDALAEHVESTFQTERVKTAIATAASGSLEKLRADLQSKSTFAVFQRDLVASYQSRLVDSLREVMTIRELVRLRDAPASELTARMMSQVSMIEICASMLQVLGAVGQPVADALCKAARTVMFRWEGASEIWVPDDPEWQTQHHDAPPFDKGKYARQMDSLETATRDLLNQVLAAARVIVVPA